MAGRPRRRLKKRYVGSFQPQLPELCEPDWHIDEATRRLGRAGLAEARAALEAHRGPTSKEVRHDGRHLDRRSA